MYESGEHLVLVTTDRQSAFDRVTGRIIAENTVYRNRCEIGYELPTGTVITEKG